MSGLGGADDRVGNQIVDRRNAGAGPAGADRDRRRLAGEDLEPVAGGMAGKVDENVDVISPDLRVELVVGQ